MKSNDVKEILNRHWDPIGVFDHGVTDEYDDYISKVLELASKRDVEKLTDYLNFLVEDHMGLGKNRTHNRYVSLSIISLLA